jgi:uncharacterized membrane protein YiaA
VRNSLPIAVIRRFERVTYHIVSARLEVVGVFLADPALSDESYFHGAIVLGIALK